MNEAARHELRDIKNTVEWELIRLTNLITDDESELRAGEVRRLRAAESRLSDTVVTLADLSKR